MDGSGVLDMADVHAMQKLIVDGGDLSKLSDWSQKQLDPTLDYLKPGYDCNALPGCALACPTATSACPTPRDAMYLTRVVNGKFRFLVTPPDAVVTATPGHAGETLDVKVRVLSAGNLPASSPKTTVRRCRLTSG